jgi:hypothetical protein
MLSQGEAICRGDVVRLGRPLWDGSQFDFLYASAPAYFDDSFATCEVRPGVVCAIAWLIPITGEEASFVRSSGWQAFERLLEEQDPDLLDKHRQQMRLE